MIITYIDSLVDSGLNQKIHNNPLTATLLVSSG